MASALYAGYMNSQPDGPVLSAEDQAAKDAQETRTAGLISGLAGSLFSEGDFTNASLAGSVGASAYRNNYLTHQEAADLQAELALCEQDETCDPYDVIEKYRDISRQNDVDLLAECAADMACINERLQEVATSADFAGLIADQPDLYGEIEGSIRPGEEVGVRIDDILRGTPLNATAEELFCEGVVGSDCDAILQDMGLERGLYVGGALVAGAAVAVAPEALVMLGNCLENPVCLNELGIAVAEASGGDALAGGGIALTVATGGKLVLKAGDEIVGLIDDAGRVLTRVDDVADGAGDLFRAADGTVYRLDHAGELVSDVATTGTIGGKTCVYSCVVDGTTRYVGITDDVARRGAEHLAQKGISIQGIRGLENLSRADARAVEQTLINYYGLGKNGGTLLNRINSISATRNPTAYEQALIRGKQILDGVDYQWTN